MGNASGGNAYIPGGGGGGGVGIAAGGATQTSGTVVFSNGNGVTFGYNNGTITATVTPGAAAGIAAVQAGTQTATSGTQVFSNSNNISFGMSGSSQITATANVGVSAVSAGTTSIAGGAVVFSNSNGVSFGLNGSTVTGSVAAQTNQSAGLFALGNTTQNSSTTLDARSLSFNGLGAISVGYSNGSIQLSGPPSSFGVSNIGNTSGNTGTYSGQVALAGVNNITLSVSSGAGGAQSITISGANTSAAQTGISGMQVSNTTYTSGTVTFQNANGISFGSSGAGGISASYTVPGATVFSNSNNVTFGLNGSTITASISVPAASSLSFSNLNGVSFGTAGSTLTASVAAQTSLSFSNANGVTFGIAGSTLTASAAGGGSPNISAGTTSGNLGSIVFSNSNGVSFGLNGSTITGSVATQSVQSVGLYGLGNTTQNSSTTLDARSLSFNALGEVTVGYSNGSIQISAPPSSIGVSNVGNTSGNTGTYSGQLVFAGVNNITLSVSSAAGGAQTITISGANAGGAQTGISGLVVSNTTYTSGTVTFQNANGISFGSSGANGISASYTVPTQTNQSIGVYGISQTTGASSSSTYDARSLSFAGYGVISIGQSNGSIQISSPGTTNFANLSVSAGTTSNSLGSVVFSNSNGVSFGLNGSTITGSVATSLTNVNISAGTTSQNLSAITFSNSNGVSFGLNGSVITASAAAGGGAALSAGTQSTNGGTVVFSNSNNITFGMSNSSVITASYSQSADTVGLYALGNTTQNSSTTLDARTLSFNALGAMTMGYSNGSIQVSAPATSSMVGVGGLSISTNGSTISVSQVALTRTVWPAGNLTAVSAPGNASMSFQYFPADNPVTASRMDALVAWTAGSSATTNTCAVAMSMYGGIFTRNGASLSSLSSGSTQTTYTYASNSAGNTQLLTGAIRPMSVPININMTPGEYFVGFNLVTATSSIGASTTNCPQSFSMMGGNQIQTALNYNEIASATNASVGLYNGMGVYSAASTGMPGALSISGIVGTGSSLSQANIAFVFRNA